MIANENVYGLRDKIIDIHNGKMPNPLMAIIGPTYRCNQHCYYCFFDHMKSSQTLTVEQLINIIDQLADFGVKGIEFCGAGEPLMMPGIEDCVLHAAKRGLKIGLLTNGVLFKDKIMSAFVQHGTYVRVSLDTVDRELYKKIRGTEDLDNVLANIKAALAYKKKYNHFCEISLKVGNLPEVEIKQLQEIMDFVQGKGIHSVQYKNIWNEEGDYLTDFRQKYELKDKVKSSVSYFIKNIKARRSFGNHCWITPVQTDIDAFGNVYLCCYYMYREEDHKIGNIFEKSFKEIWESDYHREKIKKIRKYECMKHDCRFMTYMRLANFIHKRGDWCFI